LAEIFSGPETIYLKIKALNEVTFEWEILPKKIFSDYFSWVL